MTELPNLTGMKLGNYRLERLLGRGRMGVVYLANDEALLRPTAVKILSWAVVEPSKEDPEAWFLAEARGVARLHHPAIIQIYGVAKHGPYCYIAMEYVQGVSADVLIGDKGPFAAERATEVILQIAGALQLAHTNQVIHRDVKPANVLINSDGTAKLGDFGMAVHVKAEPSAGSVRAGTPHYIAPEIWRGEPASPSSDIYALGATYFFLLTGQAPFPATDLDGLAQAHQHAEIRDPHDLLPSVPPACARIIRRCLAKSRKDRYPSAHELEWDARGLLRELESATPATPVGPPPSVTVMPMGGSFRAADPEWTGLGFALQPFSELDPLRCPYRGEPFAGARKLLHERLSRGPGSVVSLTGAAGSGRTTLARQLLAEHEGHPLRTYLDVARPSSASRTLVQRVARAFGALPKQSSGTDADIDGLLDLLRGSLSSRRDAALVVLDGLTPGPATSEGLMLLARAARSTTYFSLLLIGSPELTDELAAASGGAAAVSLPALTQRQTRDYVGAWLRASLPPEAQPLLTTPDAAMLVWHRARGDLRLVNRIAANMIRMAAREGTRVLSSWEAWAAPESEEGARNGDQGRRPLGWPGTDIVEILNRCRERAGIPARE